MFESWAKSAGYSGGAGGNPRSDFWYCGIEPGGDWLDLCKKKPLEELISESEKQKRLVDGQLTAAWDSKYKDRHPTFSSWPFVTKVAKISLVAQNKNIKDYKSHIRENIYLENGFEFHTNLYPLPFPKASDNFWSELHQKQIGLVSKAAYRAWCRENRLPNFRSLVTKFKPKCVLCFGQQYADDFLLAFSKNPLKCESIRSWELSGSKKTLRVWHLRTDTTTILLCPFLGPGGILSDESIVEIGKYLRKLK